MINDIPTDKELQFYQIIELINGEYWEKLAVKMHELQCIIGC